jgi:hypothetical protein
LAVILRQLWIRVTADRRRFGALCGALLIGMLLWARVIIIARVPRQAIAEDPVVTASSENPPPATDNPRRPAHRIELDAQPRTDPFLVNSAYFSRSSSLDTEAGKSGPEPTEEFHRSGAREYAFIRGLAELFELDAVMTGSPMAVISGQTYRQGDSVPALGHPYIRFQLSEVKSRSVILTQGSHRFELTIAAPGGR